MVLSFEVEYLLYVAEGLEYLVDHRFVDFLDAFVEDDKQDFVWTLFVLLLRMINFVSSSAEYVNLLTRKNLGITFKVVIAVHTLINVLILNKSELPIPDK